MKSFFSHGFNEDWLLRLKFSESLFVFQKSKRVHNAVNLTVAFFGFWFSCHIPTSFNKRETENFERILSKSSTQEALGSVQ